MGINYTPPSLSELLQAYNQPGLGSAIDAGRNGVLQGMQVAAQREKARLDQQNTLTSQGIAQQEANAKTSDANAKFVPAEIAEKYAGAPSGTFGAPGTLVPVTAANDFLTRTTSSNNLAASLANSKAIHDATVRQQDIDANLRAQEAQRGSEERAVANRTTAGTAALDSSAKNAPGFFQSSITNPLYSFFHRGQNMPSVQAYQNQQSAAQQLLSGQQPQLPVLGNGLPQAKPDAQSRYSQLAGQGLTKTDIYNQLHKEGY